MSVASVTASSTSSAAAALTLAPCAAVPSMPASAERVEMVDAVVLALDMLPAMQVMNGRMRSLHAAARVQADGTVNLVREDVGRHNAMDKLIGAMAADGRGLGDGFIVATSRCSYEMAQKAMAAGASLLVTISAPTALALRLAEEAGLTVVALGRGDSLRVYTHAERLIGRPQDLAAAGIRARAALQ